MNVAQMSNVDNDMNEFFGLTKAKKVGNVRQKNNQSPSARKYRAKSHAREIALKKEKEQAKKRTKSTNSTSTVNASNMGNFDILGQIDTSNYHEPSDNNTTDGMDALKVRKLFVLHQM